MNTRPFTIAIEGLDRLGKSTLIENILDAWGYYQVVHFGKPRELTNYQFDKKLYQEVSFDQSMRQTKSGYRFIYDRWHLGEAVYGPMYRGYDGNYVFDLEKKHFMDEANVRLILLVENFEVSKHFVSDGDSFDDTKRQIEQPMFINAFHKSIIKDKRIICVTAEDGGFRNPHNILEDALADRGLSVVDCDPFLERFMRTV